MPDANSAPQSSAIKHRERRTTVSTELQGWKILVVDDQPDNLRVAEATLRFYGAEVITATNGIHGLEVASGHANINLILLDLSMPEMNGWTMFEKLRENPTFTKTPVIALTAHAMDGDEEKVMSAGFNGYISKPFSVPNLVANILAIVPKPMIEEKKS